MDWADIHHQAAFEMGLEALALTFEQLVPKLGEPVAVQRQVEFTLEQPGRVDDRRVPRPGNARPHGHRRGDRARRRLQGQELDDQPGAGRPRHPGRPVPHGPMAARQPGRGVLLRADRQGGPKAQADEHGARPHHAHDRQMRATLARIALAASEIVATSRAWAPTGPGDSPTPRAGNASPLSATFWAAVRAVPGYSQSVLLSSGGGGGVVVGSATRARMRAIATPSEPGVSPTRGAISPRESPSLRRDAIWRSRSRVLDRSRGR